jgi:hypothetical protein
MFIPRKPFKIQELYLSKSRGGGGGFKICNAAEFREPAHYQYKCRLNYFGEACMLMSPLHKISTRQPVQMLLQLTVVVTEHFCSNCGYGKPL